MGFQDNSGDIILDVVLTDEGRKRLAKGDGSFEIVKFGCGDDEINYALYDLTAALLIMIFNSSNSYSRGFYKQCCFNEINACVDSTH